jgi:hypothetical protein
MGDGPALMYSAEALSAWDSMVPVNSARANA